MQTKTQKQENDNMIFGLRPIIEALKSGKQIDKLLVQNGLKNELFGDRMRKKSDYIWCGKKRSIEE